MFRVDVYNVKDEEKPSLPPYYACLASADNSAGAGQLLTVGRKNSTILLDSDKSVSRDHLHLHLLSNNPEHQEPLVLDDDKKFAAAGIPSSPQETSACEASPMGMTLVVKNLGKFGTSVLAMGPKDQGDNAADDKNQNENHSSDDSETEDESQQKAPAPSGGLPEIKDLTWFEKTKTIVARLSKDSPTAFSMSGQKLEAKQDFVVPGKATHILIQCGQVGSLIVLTRLDLTFCKSGLTKAEVSLWKKLVYCIGGSLIESGVEEVLFAAAEHNKHKEKCMTQDNNKLPCTTYLVTPQREGTGKQIIAWMLDVPFVTVGFLEALLQRKKIQDPWPKMEDFNTPVNPDYTGSLATFWTTEYPNKTRLWESCTFLCTSESMAETGYIVRSAGGNVVALYGIKEKEAHKIVQELLESPEKKDGLFSDNGRSKIAKWVKKQGIPQIKCKQVTQTLIKQEMLRDEVHDRIIGKLPVVAKEDKPVEREPEKKPSEEDDDSSVTDDEEAKIQISQASQRKPKESEDPDKNADQQATKRKRVEDDDGEEKQGSRSQRKVARSSSIDEGNENRATRESQSQKAVEILPPVQEEDSMQLNNTADASMEEEGEGVVEPSPRNKKRSREEEPKPTLGERKKKEPRYQAPLKGGSGTARLASTEDGWMIAAPKDAAGRRAYLRPKEEIMDRFHQEEPVEEAETVVCSLIARPFDPNRNRLTGVRNKSNKGGIDFKKFRKNSIIKAGRSSRIEMRSVLPKETELQRQMEEQQRALEEQQRAADELFHGGGGTRQSRLGSTTTRRKRRNV
jgi:hypothetical protein